MKLKRTMPGACAAVAVASLLGCSSSARTPRTPTAPADAAVDGRVATAELMSAQLPPAPTVGKIHRVADDEEAAPVAPRSNELSSPKDGRPSDGSRCSGHFGAK